MSKAKLFLHRQFLNNREKGRKVLLNDNSKGGEKSEISIFMNFYFWYLGFWYPIPSVRNIVVA